MPSPFIPLKRIISPPPTSLQMHPFAIPIRRKQLRANQIISHGPSPSQQKSDFSQKKSRNQHISERTDPTPNRHTSKVGQKRSDCQRDRTQPRSRCAGAPPPGGRHIRSIASSARAGEHLMCSPCEQDCPSRRLRMPPGSRGRHPSKIFKKVVDARVTTRLIYPLRDGPVAQLVRASG